MENTSKDKQGKKAHTIYLYVKKRNIFLFLVKTIVKEKSKIYLHLLKIKK